jgi:hypothetical protein
MEAAIATQLEGTAANPAVLFAHACGDIARQRAREGGMKPTVHDEAGCMGIDTIV